MTKYTPSQIQEAFQQVYSENNEKFLLAKKIAKYISEFTFPLVVRADMKNNLYSPEFDVHYSFTYHKISQFNEWLIKMCKEHPIDGKTTGRIDDMHFVITDTINGQDMRIEVFGVYDEQ